MTCDKYDNTLHAWAFCCRIFITVAFCEYVINKPILLLWLSVNK